MEKEKFSQIEVPFRKEISDRFLNLLLPNLGPREFYHGDMVAPIQLKEEVKEKKNLLEKERDEREGGILANNGFSEKKKKKELQTSGAMRQGPQNSCCPMLQKQQFFIRNSCSQ